MTKNLNANSVIRDHISKNGLITISDFMQISNSYYYNRKNIIGSSGDFITSPEISQLFGEMVGIWVVSQWIKLEKPSNIQLVELGPGNGTLMNDVLRSTKHIKNFHKNITVIFVETSVSLKNQQKKIQEKWPDINFEWVDDIRFINDQTSIFIANEFFDALPISQYQKLKKDWFEIVIHFHDHLHNLSIDHINPNPEISSFLESEFKLANHRAIVELSPMSIHYAKLIADKIYKNKGAALIIDYGYIENSETRTKFSSTLQAVKNHKYHPILQDIGEADLTAHVDFMSLYNAFEVSRCKVEFLCTQHDFLKNMGIDLRLDILLTKLDEQQKSDFLSRYERITSIKYMGELFKALSIIVL
jgi:NADH dehydrogenase [ubiquinone] 1 alpha subcomplex assembly factor 7